MTSAEKRRHRKKAEKAAKNAKPVQSASPSLEQLSLTIQQAIDLAVQHHTEGRLPLAESIYHQILQADPSQPVPLHMLGVIAHQVGKNDIAVDFITKALAIKPDYAEAHNNLGAVLKDLGRLDEAVDCYHKTLAIKPDHFEAHNNLGVALQTLGKGDEVVAHYHKAIDIKPDFAEAHYNLGAALRELGRLDEAVTHLHQSIDINPDVAEAHYTLGNVVQELGRLDEAVAHYHKAIAIRPDYTEAHSTLGLTLKELGRLDEAIIHYHKSIGIKPDYDKAHSNLGFFISYLETLGVMKSTRAEIVNGRGEAIPLLTNSFLHWFETKKWSEMNLLELGSGNSTLYFSKFFKSVTSYENNKDWFEALGQKIPENVDYIYANPIHSALKNEDLEKYDVILLDTAENRAKIARLISDKDYSGLIFFDNSERYRQSVGILSQVGFADIPFFGIKPIEDWVSCTSVLVKSDSLTNLFAPDWCRLPDLARSNDSNPWDYENFSDLLFGLS